MRRKVFRKSKKRERERETVYYKNEQNTNFIKF